MSTFDIKIIRESFEVAKPIAGEVADKFYEILWSDYPQSKALFKKTNMEKQKKQLIKSLVFIVDNLEDSKNLTEFLHGMGARHINYGTQEEHYDWVGYSLLKTFAFFFKDQWTTELETNWAHAYDAIAGLMIEGARLESDLETVARQNARLLLNQALEAEMDESLFQMAREKAKKMLKKALEEEVKEHSRKLKKSA